MKKTTLLVALCLMAFSKGTAQTNNTLSTNPSDKTESSLPGPKSPQAPALTQCLNIEQDRVGKALQETFVWTDLPKETQGVSVGFRRTFDLASKPASASLHLFADARYILWVNGTYVDRGPARFQPNGPEYDMIDIARYLKPGKNAVSLLVAGNLSGGKVMRHAPGVTASLEVDGKSLWKTDGAWRWSDRIRYRGVSAGWADLGETLVDARVEDGDWTSADYNDAAWKPAIALSGSEWGPLTARRIPMLKEKEVPYAFRCRVNLPVKLKAGERLEFATGRIVQAYPVISLTATAGAELNFEPYGVHYIAKDGPQTHFTIDSRGIFLGAIVVTKGEATITGLKLVERLYPYERLASFQSDDPFLNRLWELCARSSEVLSEDSYVDCADRERVEWMDDSPPAFDITRTAMAGPAGTDGKKVLGDPRLLAELIRRTALTLQPEGWVKAHTCSDRYDIHAKMEDRACDWVEGIRLYDEATGDTAAVREVWPAVKAQMEYFLRRRTAKGLVSARDWVVWGNPTGYLTGSSTPLNCFICRALHDASLLAGVVGDSASEQRYSKASEELKTAINRELWDERSGCFYGGYFDTADIANNNSLKGFAANKVPKAPFESHLTNGFFPPTLEANLFALDRGVVPDDRRERVLDAVMAQAGMGNIGRGMMTAYYLYKQLYALDGNDNDTMVLDLIRKKFQAMADAPLQCSWEGYSGGSKAHIYGMYPGYFLSAYVLGVRRDAPVAEKKLLIEPHPGNLKKAEGTVVTEFGPVNVSWRKDDAMLRGEITVPSGVSTTLALPRKDGDNSIQVDGKDVPGEVRGKRLCIPIPPGKHTIML